MTDRAAEIIGDAAEEAADELVAARQTPSVSCPLTAREFFTALNNGYRLPAAPWAEDGGQQ